uniref:ARAD1C20900p n=1 Tax=Blastobotrys adeninivorans TaxID=409370 RepID=A0A060T6K7_BLAAD
MHCVTNSLGRINYPKKRLNVACEICRLRKTKCDGVRPSCAFCKNIGAECVYRALNINDLNHVPIKRRRTSSSTAFTNDETVCNDTVLQQLSRLTDAIQGISDRVESIEKSIQRPQAQSSPPAEYVSEMAAGSRAYLHCGIRKSEPPLDQPYFNLETERFPWMTVKSPKFVETIFGSGFALSAEIKAREPSKVEMDWNVATVAQSPTNINHLLELYAQNVQKWFPLFDHADLHRLQGLLVGSMKDWQQNLQYDSRLCCAAMMAALGALFDKGWNVPPAEDPLDQFTILALKCLPNVLMDDSLEATKALTLTSIFYSFQGRPYMAMPYAEMAFIKHSQKISKYSDRNLQDLPDEDVRVYWIIYLHVCEFVTHVGLNDALLVGETEDLMPLPTPGSREFHCGIPNCSLRHGIQMADAYMLSEITIRRLLRRSTFCGIFSVNKSEDSLTFAPIVAKELLHQLNEWMGILPGDILGLEILASPTTEFLKMQYCACLVTIYWPAVYGIAYKESIELDSTIVNAAREFLSSCEQFFASVDTLYNSAHNELTFIPYSWSVSITVFIFAATNCKLVKERIYELVGIDDSKIMDMVTLALKLLSFASQQLSGKSLDYCHEILQRMAQEAQAS